MSESIFQIKFDAMREEVLGISFFTYAAYFSPEQLEGAAMLGDDMVRVTAGSGTGRLGYALMHACNQISQKLAEHRVERQDWIEGFLQTLHLIAEGHAEMYNDLRSRTLATAAEAALREAWEAVQHTGQGVIEYLRKNHEKIDGYFVDSQPRSQEPTPDVSAEPEASAEKAPGSSNDGERKGRIIHVDFTISR